MTRMPGNRLTESALQLLTGATNAVTGIANANMDSMHAAARPGSFQEADLRGSPCRLLHNYLVKDTKDLARLLKKRFIL